MFKSKLFCVSLVLGLSLFLASTVFAGYVTFGGGGGAGGGNVSVEFGVAEKVLFGLGFTYIFGGGDVPDDTLDYRLPHDDYTYLGSKKVDGEDGVYVTLGMNVYKKLYLFGLGGVTRGEKIGLAQSNVTGRYYREWTEYTTHGMFGGGLALGLGSKFVLEIEFDNRRGATGLIGFAW